MAVTTTLTVYPGAEMKAQDMAMLLENVTPKTKGIVWGCQTTGTPGSSSVNVSSGWIIICGRLIRVEAGSLAVTLPETASTITRYVEAKVDLENVSAPSSISIVTSPGTDTTNFNNTSDGKAYYTIATITANQAGITNVSAVSPIRTGTDDTWLDRVYPVGSIYMSVNSTDPSELFGGTWTRITNRFLIATDTGSVTTPTYPAGGTGGQAQVSYTPAGTIGGTAISVAQMPAHNHGSFTLRGSFYLPSENYALRNTGNLSMVSTVPGQTMSPSSFITFGKNAAARTSFAPTATSSGTNTYDNMVIINGTHTHTTQGSGQTHTHTFTGTAKAVVTMPPYYSVYMWRRTA